MNNRRHLRTLRALAACHNAFGRLAGAHVRGLGYTTAQFDVIATLGNTEGMTFKELGRKTVITKGTLTGVVDRLEARGLVIRVGSSCDRRSTIVRLTGAGEADFERAFPTHVAYLRCAFDVLEEPEMDWLDELLERLRRAFCERLVRR